MDDKYLTLGDGGELVVRFTDNALGDVNGPAIFVFEIGAGGRVDGTWHFRRTDRPAIRASVVDAGAEGRPRARRHQYRGQAEQPEGGSYPSRSAITGSIRVARLEGARHPTRPAPSATATTPARVIGSVGDTP